MGGSLSCELVLAELALGREKIPTGSLSSHQNAYSQFLELTPKPSWEFETRGEAPTRPPRELTLLGGSTHQPPPATTSPRDPWSPHGFSKQRFQDEHQKVTIELDKSRNSQFWRWEGHFPPCVCGYALHDLNFWTDIYDMYDLIWL